MGLYPRVMNPKWRTLSSDPVIRDRWIDLRADRCLTPSGAEISPYYVLAYPDWVHVVALTPKRDLVLVRQYRHAAGESFLELPGGGVDTRDACVEAAARRELAEETGYMSQHWRAVSVLHPNPATHTNRVHAFLALDAIPGHERSLDRGEEGLEPCVVPFDDVIQGLGAGLLGQAMHVAAVLLAAKLLERL